jgi:hypothetical protein
VANSLDRVIVQEGPRNAVVRLTGSLDTSDIAIAPVISLQDFSNNDPRMTLIGFRVDEIEFAMQSNLGLTVYWDSMNPQAIANIAQIGEFEWEGGLIPDATRPGYTGNISISSSGFLAGKPNMFTVNLEMVKLYRN